MVGQLDNQCFVLTVFGLGVCYLVCQPIVKTIGLLFGPSVYCLVCQSAVLFASLLFGPSLYACCLFCQSII